MKKIRIIAGWVLIAVYLTVVFGFISEKHTNKICNSVEIDISDSSAYGFINENYIIDLLEMNSVKLLGEPLAAINGKNVEKLLGTNLYISSVHSYKSEEGKIYIELSQREPVIRIINSKGINYYLDKRGRIIPYSDSYSPHLLVANGNITEPVDIRKVTSIYQTNYLELNSDQQVIYDLLTLSNYINENSFWKSQFVQIYVNEKYEFELIPRIGPHIILLGTIKDFKSKLDNLKILYTQGFKTKSWNNYLEINLKYKNQIVCTKI